MKRLCDVVALSATSANVFNGRISERAPAWARHCRVMVIHSDQDHAHSLTIGGEELARSSAPHGIGPITAQVVDWTGPHCLGALMANANAEVILSVTETTAGEGLAIIEYLDRMP